MQYVRFGNTGMTVSRLCLGTMMFSRRLDYPASARVLAEALDAGINFVDTAESYGESEDFLGRALAESGKRGDLFLATKVYTSRAAAGRAARNSRANILHSLDRSLALLRTDRVDLYQLHHPDPDAPAEESLAALDAAVKAGKVRYVGVSNHYAWQMAHLLGLARLHRWDPLVSIQCRYNVIDRTVETETVPFARKFNVALMAYAPLAGGVLTGKYARTQAPPDAGRAANDPKLQRTLKNDKVFAALDALRPIAERNSVDLSQLALLWLLSKPHVTCPILGGSTPEQYRPFYAVADKRLSPEDVAAVDALSADFVYRPFENQPHHDAPALSPAW